MVCNMDWRHGYLSGAPARVCAVLWAVSQAVSGYEFNGDSKVSLHMGMFVIGIIGYLFFSLGWFIYSAPVGG